MPTDWIINNVELIVTISLLVVIVLLGFIAWLLMTNRPAASQELEVTFAARYEIDQLITDALEKVGGAIQHHAEISAVLGLMQQLNANPDALELIKSYPETVRAAAWLHYINTLGADLQATQKYLSGQHQRYPTDEYGYVRSAQNAVDTIRAKLDAAIKASGQSGLRSV